MFFIAKNTDFCPRARKIPKCEKCDYMFASHQSLRQHERSPVHVMLCRPCPYILLPSVILSKLQHSPTGSSREGVKGESFTEKPLDAANNDAETAVC